ncbi:hypothetical protein L8P27_05170 [Enterobacter asburiae]|uniref:hypothetical protein n=1 Tax=Enterobacter asburiae TaxID=61645 RepID=UPI002003E8CD|nr:hypothetical protein [Enterobacter asburiae]MCK7227243.1 hypothetical protein [Enterobacter asburiae]
MSEINKFQSRVKLVKESLSENNDIFKSEVVRGQMPELKAELNALKDKLGKTSHNVKKDKVLAKIESTLNKLAWEVRRPEDRRQITLYENIRSREQRKEDYRYGYGFK